MRRSSSTSSSWTSSNLPNDIITIDIETIDLSGDGLARDRGGRVVVPFTIPGERVRVRIVKRRGRDAWGVVESIVKASPHRVAPRCQHFGPPDLCGGCTWQHIAYPEQLRLKTDLVRRLVASVGRTPPQVEDTIPATPLDDPWGYRHKVHFVFGTERRRGALLMGHFVRGTRRLFGARECPVHDQRGNEFAFTLRDECAGSGVLAAPDGALRHVAVRIGANTGETMATLVVADTRDKRLRDATRRALDRPKAPDSFHLNIHDRDDGYIFGSETRHISGPRHLRERIADTTFLVSPTAFFQTNVHAAEMLVRLVLDALPAGEPVLDLYAGAGLFALPLARRGDRVIAVEENRAATEDGAAALRLNRIAPERCRFVARRVEAALGSIGADDAVHVVLDPPREGCDRAVVDEVFGRLRPARVAYVSCNPEALARDLALMVRRGYGVERLQPVDMFPHTAHIETVAVLHMPNRAGTTRTVDKSFIQR
jgi:23S rRNA (uracil1939-C5)-methyltransferase